MSARQTRRTVSLNRQLFERICDEGRIANKSVSQWLTELVTRELARVQRPFNIRLGHVSRVIGDHLAAVRAAKRNGAA